MATTFTIGTAQSVGTSQMPPALQGIMDQATWNILAREMAEVEDNATMWTCLGEFGVCCVTGFFCIFCCHPCLHKIVAKQQAEEYVTTLTYDDSVTSCIEPAAS